MTAARLHTHGSGVAGVAAGLVVAGALAGALWATVGVPDAAALRRFWGGERPGSDAALAAAALLVWVAALGVGTWLLGIAVVAARDLSARARGGRRAAAAVLLLGLVLLAIGAVRHIEPRTHLCCGRADEVALP